MKLNNRVFSALALLSLWIGAFGAERNPAPVTALLNRIGGDGTADKFETVLDETVADGTKETFVITASGGKPCIKGSTLSALTAGIGWYLNHHANINLTWNQPHADLAGAELPVPAGEETHNCDAVYRYYLNYCTYSYSMSTWTWERWQEEIDWMALRGVNMPLQIVGLEEVWRKFLMEDYGYTLDEVSKYVAGPCYMAWFGMNNLEGTGGPNPQWWYERQAQLGKKIGDRMRELGIEPVLPGFCQVPSDFTDKTGILATGQGSWFAGIRPYLANPGDEKFDECAAKFYARVKEVMGDAKYFSMDPFHEGGAVALDAPTLYKRLYQVMDDNNPGSKWVIQQWQWNSSQMKAPANVPVGKLIILDLFADAKPTWSNSVYGQQDLIYSTIFNFGGRTGYFGRAQAVIDGYWQAKTSKETVKGIGAAPEAIEQTPVMYDLLFELPWYDTKPDAKQWFADYSTRRYGAENSSAAEAWDLIRTSALNMQGNGQGPHEAWMCARPNLDGNMVSSWGVNTLFYDPNMLTEAAYKLLESGLDGENYSFDLTDISRQVLTDYVRKLIPAIKQAHTNGDTERFEMLRDAFLQLILDVDELLNTNSEFMLGNWTERARKMADEMPGTTLADRDWLELNNARQLITTWTTTNTNLRDYSYRQWGGMMKDFYYERWKKWFDDGMKSPNWFQWEWNWAHSNPGAYSATPTGDSKEVAARLLPKYLSPFTPATDKPYYVPRLISTDVSGKLTDKTSRGNDYFPALNATGTRIAEIAIDFNKNNIYDDDEKATDDEAFAIPADAPVGERKCRITLEDGTVFIYTLSIVEEITEPRTVTVKTSDPAKGSVSIEGTDQLSVTNMEVVTILATPTQKFDFDHWTDADGNNAGNDNPMKYYGKEPAEFTAHFVENKWGIPEFVGGSYPPKDMMTYGQYLISLGVTQGGQSTTFFESDTHPTEHFHYVTNRIKAAPGGAFHFDYQGQGDLRYQFLSAYCDLNADGKFDMNSAELLGTKGTHKTQDASVGKGGFDVLLPYDTPLETTHIRLRFDGAWMDSEVPGSWVDPPGAFKPEAATNRIIYEVLLEVNKGVEYPTTITVKSGNEDLGTVRSENATNVYLPGEQVILTAFPTTGSRVSHWEDSYGRTLPMEWMNGNTIEFTAFDNAEITAVFERIPIEIDLWKFNIETDDEGDYYISELIEAGQPDLDLSDQHSAYGSEISYINPEVFAGNTVLRSLVLPDRELIRKGELIYQTATVSGTVAAGNGNANTQLTTPLDDNTTITYTEPFTMKISGYNNGATFNPWGSVLFANGTNGLADNYGNGWSQFYLKSNGTIDVKWDSSSAVNFPVSTIGKFEITVEYLGDKQTRITVANEAGQKVTKTLTNNADMKPISKFTTAMPEGMSVQIRFSRPDVAVIPGELLLGCRNLMDIHLSDDNTYATEKNGVIYDKSGNNCIAYPEGRILGGAFSLKTGNGINELIAAPVLEGDSYTNLGISTTTRTTNWNTLWTIDTDGSLVHYNSGLGVNSDGHTLSTDDAVFSYALSYDEGEPSISFTDADNRYMTPTGLSTEPFSFDFYPVTELSAPEGQIRTVAFPVNVIVPDDTEVFALDKVGSKGGYISHIMPGHIIPAGTGVLIEGTAKPFEITAQPSVETADLLDGTTVDLVLSSPYYVLEGEYFVRHESGTVPANTGYVPAGLLDVASFRYQPADYHPVEINGWKFDWRYSYNENVICLTSAVESGDPELDLSKPVEETGDQIVDIDPAMFVNHPDLFDITLPASRMAHHYYNSALEGAGVSNHVLTLPQPLGGDKPWQMTMEVSSDGSGFNQWGSGLFATGTNATANTYPGGFQLYLQTQSNNGGHIVCKYNGSTETTFNNVPINTQIISEGVERVVNDFTIAFNYSKDAGGNYAMTIKVSCNGNTESKTLRFKHSVISTFCASIPVGVNINKIHLEGEEIFFPYNEGELFAGCMNLQNIHLADGADYAIEQDGVLYDINNPQNCIAFPEGRLFARPFVLTSDSEVSIGANPVLVNDELTETDVIVSNDHTLFNSLWTLGGEKRLTHVNSGAHLNALGNGISATHGEFDYKLNYGDGEPSIHFSLNEERHLSMIEDALLLDKAPHFFRFRQITHLEAPVEDDTPHSISFPVPVIVGEGAVVKGVESVSATGAQLFKIDPGTVVPAGYALITVGGTSDFRIADATTPMTLGGADNNRLLGTTNAVSLNEPYYLLEGKQFVRYANGIVPANSAYIPADELVAENIPYDLDSTTGIDSIENVPSANEIFDLTGRRVRGTLRPGFYIRGGKKIFIR